MYTYIYFIISSGTYIIKTDIKDYLLPSSTVLKLTKNYIYNHIWLNTTDFLLLKSSSEDVWVFLLVFLCLGQVGEESTLY